MNRTYEMATPRLALGTAAVALSAIAMAVMVIIPATMDAEAAAPVVTVAALGADSMHGSGDARADAGCADVGGVEH